MSMGRLEAPDLATGARAGRRRRGGGRGGAGDGCVRRWGGRCGGDGWAGDIPRDLAACVDSIQRFSRSWSEARLRVTALWMVSKRGVIRQPRRHRQPQSVECGGGKSDDSTDQVQLHGGAGVVGIHQLADGGFRGFAVPSGGGQEERQDETENGAERAFGGDGVRVCWFHGGAHGCIFWLCSWSTRSASRTQHESLVGDGTGMRFAWRREGQVGMDQVGMGQVGMGQVGIAARRGWATWRWTRWGWAKRVWGRGETMVSLDGRPRWPSVRLTGGA